MTQQFEFSSDIKNSYILAATVFVLLTSLAAFMFVPLFTPGDPVKTIPLSGKWKISLDDSSNYSSFEYDDAAWDSISLPGEIVPYAIQKQNKVRGVCWLRKTFHLDDSDGSYGLILGRIANADETYLNGERIGGMGQFPPHEFSMWNFPRNYLLPDNHLHRRGKNVIAVRVSYNVTGEIIGRLMVTDADYMNRYAPFSRFIHVSMGYACMSIALVLILVFLFSRLKQLSFNENFYYFLQFFVGLPAVLDLCLTWQIYPDHVTRLKVLGLAWVAINLFHPAFLHRFYRLKRTWPERVLWAYFLFCLIMAIFFIHQDNIRFWGRLLIIGTWFIGFYNMSCHIEALFRKREYAGIFSVFGFIVILASMNDGLIYFNKYVDFDISFFGWTPTVMVLQFGAVFLYLGTFFVLENKYKEMVDEIDDLNRNLENFIIENSMLNKTLAQSQNKPSKPQSNITAQAEEKILAVIDIIQENFLSELSRTDLAESVGVHPDSLGKQFKAYTGKKLGDFIYELRIQEAARRLRETDDKIIAIAFDVGFDSLRTFNRIFPKFMTLTPTQYRQQHQIDQAGADTEKAE
ncbi:MAG: helix-turn-helix domain-containing protein [Thermodesulfobacteriota bacterium]|nr:helix-turn-helix domain-containing protein [Thermodesulfobacteriota bacterium]